MAFSRKSSWNVFFALLVVLILAPPPAHPASSPPPEKSEAPIDVDNPPEEFAPDKGGASQSMALSGSEGSSIGDSLSKMQFDVSAFTGAATFRIPIEVPPGRNGMAPNLALVYSSQKGNGWLGVGWDLDMGAIQRSTKFGLDYNGNDFVAVANGSTSELVPIGNNYYAPKIEGAFLRYYYNSTTGRWEVSGKNGATYYYGSTPASRQDNNSVNTVFKWCLDRVEDTNGNYMTVSYMKDQGEIYLDSIYYTSNASLGPSNYVKFYLEERPDEPDIYLPNFKVNTRYRLKTIEIRTKTGTDWDLVRAYKLLYYLPNETTARSTLSNLQLYGSDSQVVGGDIQSGTMMPVFSSIYEPGGDGLFMPDYNNPALPNNIEGGYLTRNSGSGYMITGDFNGDGRTDYMWIPSYGDGRWLVAYGTDNGLTIPDYDPPALPAYIGGYLTHHTSASYMKTGDFNGDGKTDFLWMPYNGDTRWLIAYGTDTGFTTPDYNNPALPKYLPGTSIMTRHTGSGYMKIGDFNGDGRSDYMWIPYNGDGRWLIAYGSDNGFIFPDYDSPALPASIDGYLTRHTAGGYMQLGDFNGDGRTDFMWIPYNGGDTRWLVAFGTDNGFILPNYNAPALPSSLPSGHLTRHADASFMRFGDINGDGKTDYMWIPYNGDGRWLVAHGTGNGFSIPDYNLPALPTALPSGYLTRHSSNPAYMMLGDFNGDGKTDFMWMPYNGDTRWLIAYSTGNVFILPDYNDPALPRYISGTTYGTRNSSAAYTKFGDFNGDRKIDYMWIPYNGDGRWMIAWGNDLEHTPDLLTSITNGAQGTFSLGYAPSTKFNNTQMPFSVQIVKSITTNDNNDITATTLYYYADGYYDIFEREFRGFGNVLQTNPDNTTVEQWFHQDNVYKGLIEHQETRDAGGNLYAQTNNTYSSATPYSGSVFPYLSRVDEFLVDGSANYKHFATDFEYNDAYGNITRKYQYGDLSIPGDERDERIEYTYDPTKWIVSSPSHTYVMDNTAVIKAQSWFTYDPANGNLLTKTDWLDGGVNPVTSFTYDPYGNRATTTDPNGNVTTISYDSTYTYPTTVTDQHFGFSTVKTYDLRYGKPLSETDVNGNTTTYEYDVFGRPKKATSPYDNTSPEGTQSIYYENFGQGVGYQRVATHSTEQSGTSNYIWSESYFDGFGRTIMTRSEGPDGKVIVTETVYDPMGRVSYSSLPYFEGLETPRWVSYTYDPVGRVTRVTNPDLTYVTKSYMLGTTTSTDANGHKKEADADAYGRLVVVREYTGTSPNFTLYATTRYRYDVLGNLVQVTDTANHITSIGYDTLSRKVWMTDPDMGYWTYNYDANGNLASQTDAKGQTILFAYDALNRLTSKHYPTGPNVVYSYDEPFSINPLGRLTTVVDDSGTTKFFYDKLGRTTRTIKTVDGVDYTTESSYDALGRTTAVIYPDPAHETVPYSYDTGGNLQTVGTYATYSNYNALGQAGTVTYGNGAATTYQFDPANNRLFSITTNSSGQGRQNLSYAYDNVGNITTITDLIDPSRSQTFAYDDLNRISQAQSSSYGTINYALDEIGNLTNNSRIGSYAYSPTQPHAVVQAGASTYSYDANGNMTGRISSTLTYDYENRLSSLTTGAVTVSFIYDSQGSRVKKIGPSATTVYIGKLYECTGGVCTKNIFAGANRIVSKYPAATYYYHTDHLRSSTVVTDASGTKVEEIYYYPFGETRINSGSVNLPYKYTGQEEDAETGLYYYGARYYDPVVGRFVSADTIVPNPGDPQDLNRYTYAGNNPLLYIDPTGHFKLKDFFKAVVTGFVGGAVFVISGGNPAVAGMLAGMSAGATSAAINGGGLQEILQGAAIGGILGGIGGGLYSINHEFTYAMLAAGGGYATATGGLDGLAYFAGGVTGGALGAVWASNITMPKLGSDDPIEGDPFKFNGKRLTATDAEGNIINSWKASSGLEGTTPAQQGLKNIGPIPEAEGIYSVNPSKIEKWSDLPFLKKMAANIGLTKTWRWGVPAWGHYRVPIDIVGGSILGRDSFFIHGGWFPGSAGCIDVGFGELSFFNYLSSQRGSIPLTVQYGN